MLLFFKQNTAYEMRISDWSSDVCSSDLQLRQAEDPRAGSKAGGAGQSLGEVLELRPDDLPPRAGEQPARLPALRLSHAHRRPAPPRAAVRRRPVQGDRTAGGAARSAEVDRKSTRLNSSH